MIKNALPFASANDPRVPVALGSALTPKVAAEDGITTPLWLGQLWKNQFDPMVLASRASTPACTRPRPSCRRTTFRG